MIENKENYVSYEIAKLLKEKGFDWKCCQIYYDDNKSQIYFNEGNTNHNNDKNKISASTLQMATKWIREIHKLVLYPIVCTSVKYDKDENEIGRSSYWSFEVCDTDDGIILYNREDEGHYEYSSYEEATEEAIRYCLTNLI